MDLGKDKVSSLLFKFSIPAITGMLVNALYNVVDRIFISYGVGSMAFSSLTITMPISTIILAFSMLTGLGAAALISIRLGEQRKDDAEKVLGNALTLLVIISILLSAIGLIFLDPILLFFQASPDTISYARDYMSVIFGGIVFQTVGFGMNHALRASGKPKLAMMTMLIGAILNIILDALFIMVFKWGVRGAAIATIVSQFVSMAWVLSCYIGRKSAITLHSKYFVPDFKVVLTIFSIGVSSFATQMAASVVGIIANTQLRTYGDDLALGSMGVVSSIAMLILMPVFGLNQGSQPIIGFNYGAKNYARVKQTLIYTIVAATVICTVGWVLVELAPGIITRMFTPDSDLAEATVHALRVFLFVLPLVGSQIIAVVFFQAIGRATTALILSMLRQVILLIPCYLILPKFFGLTGVWLAAPVSDTISVIITMIVFIYSIKKLTAHTNSYSEKA